MLQILPWSRQLRGMQADVAKERYKLYSLEQGLLRCSPIIENLFGEVVNCQSVRDTGGHVSSMLYTCPFNMQMNARIQSCAIYNENVTLG